MSTVWPNRVQLQNRKKQSTSISINTRDFINRVSMVAWEEGVLRFWPSKLKVRQSSTNRNDWFCPFCSQYFTKRGTMWSTEQIYE
jgi:hypothetical protein